MNIEETIIRVALGRASPAEVELVEEWRHRGDENEEHYREVVSIVRLGQELKGLEETKPVSAAEIVRLAEASRTTSPVGMTGAPARRDARGWLVAAAVAASILLGIGLLRTAGPFGPGIVPDRVAYQTAANETRTVQMPDGTLIYLAPETRLEIVDPGPNPELWLEGRAFFAVPRQNGRRLTVATPGGEVTVLGTRFDVNTQVNDLEVLVVDGRVALSAGSAEVEVGSGEMSVVNSGEIEGIVSVDDPLAHLDWMGRTMIFQTTPLERAAAEIQRRYGATLEITSPELAQRTVTAAFHGEPFPEVMMIVCTVVQARCDVDGMSVTLGL